MAPIAGRLRFGPSIEPVPGGRGFGGGCVPRDGDAWDVETWDLGFGDLVCGPEPPALPPPLFGTLHPQNRVALCAAMA